MVDKVTDKPVIEAYGKNVIPGFVVNSKFKAAGRLRVKAEITRWIKEEFKR